MSQHIFSSHWQWRQLKPPPTTDLDHMVSREPKIQDTYLHDDLANGSAIGGDVKENSGGHFRLIIGCPLTQRLRTHVTKVLI